MANPRRTERQLRDDLIRFSRLCYERRLLVALDGNLSARLGAEQVLCTRAGCHKGLVTDDDLLVVERHGQLARGNGRPTSELAMHLACYDARPDVAAVIHAHPPICTAFTIAGVTLARCVLPEVVLTLGAVPTLPYDTTGTRALAERVGQAVAQHDAMMLDRHGAVCVGSSLLDAFCKLETMEHMAQVMKAAHELGAIRDLPCDEAVHLRKMGLARYGGPPAAVARAGEQAADLPASCFTCAGCERAPGASARPDPSSPPGPRPLGPVSRSDATPASPVRDGSAVERSVQDAIRRILG
jgi:L-fuculose-phosphate aldolase